MKNYLVDKNSMDIPWIESPFFESILNNSDYNEEEKQILRYYNENGYVVIDLELTDSYIESLLDLVKKEIDDIKTQDPKYHYSDSPRIFEGWKTNPFILELARHPKIISTLKSFSYWFAS